MTARVVFGNHAAVVVPQATRDRIRRFYRDVLGCTITRETNEKDDIRMGDGFFIAFVYEDGDVALDERGFSRAIYLEIQTDNVDDTRKRIVAFGVTVLDIADPHLYFQAPGGQVLRLVGLNEEISPNMREPPTIASYRLTYSDD